GAKEMEKLSDTRLGFAPQESSPELLDKRLYQIGRDAARKKFSPEFMNRIDKLVVFRRLTEASLRQILDLELQAIQNRILKLGRKAFMLRYTDRAKDFLLEQGTDSKYGARPLKRVIERNVLLPLSNLIATHQIDEGEALLVELGEDSSDLTFLKQRSMKAVAGAPDRLVGGGYWNNVVPMKI